MDVLDLQWNKWRIKKNINQIEIYTDIGNISIQSKIGIQPQGISEDGFVRSELDNTVYSYSILDGIYTGRILNEKINSNGYFEFVQTSYNLLENKNSSWICTYLFSSKFHGFTCMGLNNTYSKYAHGMIIYDNKRYWLPQWTFLITNPTCSRHSAISNYTFSLCYNVIIDLFKINIHLNIKGNGDFGTKTNDAISWISGSEMTGTHIGNSITEVVIGN